MALSAAGSPTVADIIIFKGDVQSAPFKDAVMGIEVPDKSEMLGEAAFLQHQPGIAAHRKHLAGFDDMVIVQHERMGMLLYGALIDHRLTVVLAILPLEVAIVALLVGSIWLSCNRRSASM